MFIPSVTDIVRLVPIYGRLFEETKQGHEHAKDLKKVANRWSKLLSHVRANINPLRVKADKKRKQLLEDRVRLGKGYGLLHSIQNRPENPWQMDREFMVKAVYCTCRPKNEIQGNKKMVG